MNQNIPQLATIRINCNNNIGTAVFYFPSEKSEDVYVLTAKHCLAGKNFDKNYSKADIVLEQIFNSTDNSYHSYQLTETDVVITSGDAEDIALLILPKQRILELTGRAFYCQVINTDEAVTNYLIRGFADFNNQEADRPFPLCFIEDQKDNKHLFVMKSETQLDTYYQQALENVEGLSGSGAFAVLDNNFYLVGIVHSYEDANLFTATKVLAFNQLIPPGKFELIYPVMPELSDVVISSFAEMDKNLAVANSRARDTVGSFNVPRDNKKLVQMITESRMTAIHGQPGVGKSALAKAAVATLKENGTTIITFTAEQLYAQTLSEALIKAGYTASLEQLLGSPLSGKRVLVWIESFEKLIESGFEGAFNELLGMLKKYPQLNIVITIRDYLLQRFKITYQYELPEQILFYRVNEFNDDETAQIRQAIPELNPLLDNEKIHHLLKTPYYLDKAARIIPQLLNEAQLDEPGFKRLMWQNIIEVGNTARGATFSAVCLKRAREMSLYTTTEEPGDLIQDLVRDNILQIENSELADRYSPSHDILEDWALVRFITHQYRDSTDPKTFIINLETSPAIRRAFRLWLDEFYKQEPETSASFVHSLILDPDLPQTWKDELIVASLRSGHASQLINALKPQLLANDGIFLRQVIQLLETGCKTIDPKSRDFEQLLPVGTGWDAIITFVRNNLETIESLGTFEFLYLSAIEGWSKQLPDFNINTFPPASADAALLLKNFIQKYQDKISGYRRRRLDSSYLKRYAAILFKLTGAAQEIVKELIDAACSIGSKHTTWANEDTLEVIRDYMIDGVMSDQIVKYFPDEVLRVAAEEWLEKPKTRSQGSIMGMIHRQQDIKDFGLDEHINERYDFSSGYQTFFYWLFLYHPDKALDFLIPFLNNAFQKNQQILKSVGGEIEDITIQFPDGSTQTYFTNQEYWLMYRGTHSRNRLITSLLMGLEAALLDLADQGEKHYPAVSDYIKKIIRSSNNVAVLGVVSSVIQAHPSLLDESSVAIFSVPVFYRWDGNRWSSEMLSIDTYNDDPFEKQERERSNQKLHRRKFYQGMVGFVADYMFYYGKINELLFKVVDEMWATAPKNDPLWRKFLFDMDARKYDFKPVDKAGYENMVQLVPGYDQEVKETILSREDASEFVPSGNSVWARKVFNNEDMPDRTYEVWKSGYNFLKSPQGKNNFMTAPGTMAAVGLRDYFEQMLPQEIQWCREELLKHGERKLVHSSAHDRHFNIMDENPAMMGLSYVFKGEPDEATQNCTKELIFRLLTDGMEERPKLYLEAGLALHSFLFQPQFVTNCWYGLIALIELEKEGNKEKKSYYDFNLDEETEQIDIDKKNAEHEAKKEQLIKSVVEGVIVPPDEVHASLDMATHWIQDDALRVIPLNTELSVHHQFIQQLFKLHLDFLNDPNQRHKYDYHDSRSAFTFFYPRYLLNQPQPKAKVLFQELLDLTLIPTDSVQTEEYSKFLFNLVKEFIRAVNDGAPLENFWKLWEFLRDWLIEHKKAFLLPLLLMDLDWTANSEGWHVLEGKNLFYKDFIIEWGFNVINTTIKFLSGIAFNKFMPESINWIAGMLKSQNATQVDLKVAGRFVEKAFYKYGDKIKGDKHLLKQFLFILDFLIDKCSSKAYMLKEELVQYK